MVSQGGWRFPQAAAEGDVISTESRPGLERSAVETVPGISKSLCVIHIIP